MGLYYFLLLFLGIAVAGMGVGKIIFSESSKRGIFHISVGSVLVVSSVLLLMPESSDVISQMLIRLK